MSNVSTVLDENKPQRGTPRPSAAELKAAMVGKWFDYFASIASIGHDAEGFSTSGQTCPKCGGVNRFSRRVDFASSGRVHCRGCFFKRNGDGLATAQWLMGWTFTQARRSVENYLGGGYSRPLSKIASKPAIQESKPKPETTPLRVEPDFSRWVANAQALKWHKLPSFAEQRGLSLDSLVAFGFKVDGGDAVFPERHAGGSVSAVVTRLSNGVTGNRYRCGRGHRRGFGYPETFRHRYPVVMIPEGVLDAVAFHSAGIDAISRSKLDADLRPLANLIRFLLRDTRVVVLVENDKPEVFESNWEKVVGRAVELAKAARRNVEVARYPLQRGKDANDCWKSVCQEIPDKIKAGKKLLSEILEKAIQVEWATEIIEANKEEAECIIDMELAFLKRDRDERGSDELGKGCGLPRTNQRERGDKLQVMGSLIECSRWTCSRCRARMKTVWETHLLSEFAKGREIYAARICGNSEEFKKAKEAITKKISRGRGNWAIVKQYDVDDESTERSDWVEAVVFSTTELPEPIEYFNLMAFPSAGVASRDGQASEIERLFSFTKSVVGIADHYSSKPITTSSEWVRSLKPEEQHWEQKMRAILQRNDVSQGVATKEQGKRIRKLCRSQKFDHIGFRVGGLECIVTNLPNPDMRCDGEPMDCADIAAEDFFSSPAWRAKPTGGWSPVYRTDSCGNKVHVNAPPQAVRAVAKKLNIEVVTPPTKATGAVADSAVAKIPSGEIFLQENFFAKLAEQKIHFQTVSDVPFIY